ncbi:Cdc6/Cdc18 family protein [Halorientalis halophila]|uniref:Cdc6/Cdc18 family protein n=1 Tax=Halorientalis halophila TaxID=3108499 RepID=UPI003009AC51
MTTVIQNARVLQDDFLPKEIVHRHEEVNQMSKALEPVLDDDRPQDTFLVGPSGAGKTCIARYTVDKLQEQVLDVESHYIDCWQHSNRFRVLYKILEGVGTSYDVHRSTPLDEMVSRIEAVDSPYLLVLDEVDQLEDKGVLRKLYPMPHITMVLIANRKREVTASLDERLQSRLRSSVTISFDRYTQAELVSLLEDRIEWGLAPGAISTAQVERIADAAAGNARDAIGILRSAARNADHEGAAEIRPADVSAAIPTAREELHERNLKKLTDDQRAVFDVLAEADELPPREIYERYESRVPEPKTERTVRTYLRKLDDYDLVRSAGNGPNRTYEAIER